MKYIDEFRNQSLVATLLEAIKRISKTPVRIMEVCGGHTLAMRKYGIQHLLPGHIELLSGPGCPVCVTPRAAIDKIIAYSKMPEVIVATYGDLIRVPGSESSLNIEKALGADIRIVHSSLEALKIAAGHPDKKVIFPGIGFETTTPASAVAILEAQSNAISNFHLFSMHKVMPPAMSALIDQGVHIDGYIGPGHVTVIAGADMYKPLLARHRVSVVISGFEPVDLLQSIYMIVSMVEEKRYGIEIQYMRAVTSAGNNKAQQLVNTVFEPCDAEWRGLGMIASSGLAIKEQFRFCDADRVLPLSVASAPEPSGCLCSEILRGMKKPVDCRLFGKLCTPSNPIGACMVSGEGACQAYYLAP